jgi:predicted metal-binding protein
VVTAQLHVCLDCRGPRPKRPITGEPLLAQLRAEVRARFAPEAVVADGYPCLGLCARGGRVSLSGPGRWSYLFERIASPGDIADLLTFVDAWRATADGVVPKESRPKALRVKSLARVPPLGRNAAIASAPQIPTHIQHGEPR